MHIHTSGDRDGRYVQLPLHLPVCRLIRLPAPRHARRPIRKPKARAIISIFLIYRSLALKKTHGIDNRFTLIVLGAPHPG